MASIRDFIYTFRYMVIVVHATICIRIQRWPFHQRNALQTYSSPLRTRWWRIRPPFAHCLSLGGFEVFFWSFSSGLFQGLGTYWGEKPKDARPKHLLWALLFLKVYATESINSLICGADEKTCRKWSWTFVRLQSQLEVVRFILRTGTQEYHTIIEYITHNYGSSPPSV